MCTGLSSAPTTTTAGPVLLLLLLPAAIAPARARIHAVPARLIMQSAGAGTGTVLRQLTLAMRARRLPGKTVASRRTCDKSPNKNDLCRTGLVLKRAMGHPSGPGQTYENPSKMG